MNTDLAKKWLNELESHTYESHRIPPGVPSIQEQSVLAFAKYLDEMEEGKFGDFVDMLSGAPRKEDKPVCASAGGNGGAGPAQDVPYKPVWPCHTEGCPIHDPQPKPEPIEELSGGVVYADARDEVSKKIAEQMARKIIELQNKLNEVIRRLNTITK